MAASNRTLMLAALALALLCLAACGDGHTDNVEAVTFITATKACEQAGQKLVSVGQTLWRRDERTVFSAYCTSGVTVRGEFRR